MAERFPNVPVRGGRTPRPLRLQELDRRAFRGAYRSGPKNTPPEEIRKFPRWPPDGRAITVAEFLRDFVPPMTDPFLPRHLRPIPTPDWLTPRIPGIETWRLRMKGYPVAAAWQQDNDIHQEIADSPDWFAPHVLTEIPAGPLFKQPRDALGASVFRTTDPMWRGGRVRILRPEPFVFEGAPFLDLEHGVMDATGFHPNPARPVGMSFDQGRYPRRLEGHPWEALHPVIGQWPAGQEPPVTGVLSPAGVPRRRQSLEDLLRESGARPVPKTKPKPSPSLDALLKESGARPAPKKKPPATKADKPPSLDKLLKESGARPVSPGKPSAGAGPYGSLSASYDPQSGNVTTSAPPPGYFQEYPGGPWDSSPKGPWWTLRHWEPTVNRNLHDLYIRGREPQKILDEQNDAYEAMRQGYPPPVPYPRWWLSDVMPSGHLPFGQEGEMVARPPAFDYWLGPVGETRTLFNFLRDTGYTRKADIRFRHLPGWRPPTPAELAELEAAARHRIPGDMALYKHGPLEAAESVRRGREEEERDNLRAGGFYTIPITSVIPALRKGIPIPFSNWSRRLDKRRREIAPIPLWDINNPANSPLSEAYRLHIRRQAKYPFADVRQLPQWEGGRQLGARQDAAFRAKNPTLWQRMGTAARGVGRFMGITKGWEASAQKAPPSLDALLRESGARPVPARGRPAAAPTPASPIPGAAIPVSPLLKRPAVGIPALGPTLQQGASQRYIQLPATNYARPFLPAGTPVPFAPPPWADPADWAAFRWVVPAEPGTGRVRPGVLPPGHPSWRNMITDPTSIEAQRDIRAHQQDMGMYPPYRVFGNRLPLSEAERAQRLRQQAQSESVVDRLLAALGYAKALEWGAIDAHSAIKGPPSKPPNAWVANPANWQNPASTPGGRPGRNLIPSWLRTPKGYFEANDPGGRAQVPTELWNLLTHEPRPLNPVDRAWNFFKRGYRTPFPPAMSNTFGYGDPLTRGKQVFRGVGNLAKGQPWRTGMPTHRGRHVGIYARQNDYPKIYISGGAPLLPPADYWQQVAVEEAQLWLQKRGYEANMLKRLKWEADSRRQFEDSGVLPDPKTAPKTSVRRYPEFGWNRIKIGQMRQAAANLAKKHPDMVDYVLSRPPAPNGGYVLSPKHGPGAGAGPVAGDPFAGPSPTGPLTEPDAPLTSKPAPSAPARKPASSMPSGAQIGGMVQKLRAGKPAAPAQSVGDIAARVDRLVKDYHQTLAGNEANKEGHAHQILQELARLYDQAAQQGSRPLIEAIGNTIARLPKRPGFVYVPRPPAKPGPRKLTPAEIIRLRGALGAGGMNTGGNIGAWQPSGFDQMQELYRNYTGGKATDAAKADMRDLWGRFARLFSRPVTGREITQEIPPYREITQKMPPYREITREIPPEVVRAAGRSLTPRGLVWTPKQGPSRAETALQRAAPFGPRGSGRYTPGERQALLALRPFSGHGDYLLPEEVFYEDRVTWRKPPPNRPIPRVTPRLADKWAEEAARREYLDRQAERMAAEDQARRARGPRPGSTAYYANRPVRPPKGKRPGFVALPPYAQARPLKVDPAVRRMREAMLGAYGGRYGGMAPNGYVNVGANRGSFHPEDDPGRWHGNPYVPGGKSWPGRRCPRRVRRWGGLV